MTTHLKPLSAPEILQLIQQFLSESEQQWLNQQLNYLLQNPMGARSQQQQLIDELCGAWADDASIPTIFQEIEQQRILNKSREVSF